MDKKDCRVTYYGEEIADAIDKYIESKDINYILELYKDEDIRIEIRKFEDQSRNKEYIEKFDRVYPIYDFKRRNVYWRYWPTSVEASRKFKDLMPAEIEILLEPFKGIRGVIVVK